MKKYITALMAAVLFAAGSLCARAESKISIGNAGLFRNWSIDRPIDAVYKEKLNAQGYSIGNLEYGDITAEKLKPFNLVVVQWAPWEGDTAGNRQMDRIIPILKDYVQGGGGLLITCENSYSAYKAVNRLLSVFGAEVKNEGIVDEKNTFRQKNYMQFFFAKTGNLNHSHPVAAGIDTLTYPIMSTLSEGYGTMPLTMTDDWTPVVRADAAAKSSKDSIPSAPVILAARDFGKGRVVAMPMHSTFYLSGGCHRIWEGITMNGGGYRLMDNIFRWLAEPSLKDGSHGGYVETKEEAAKHAAGVASSLDVYKQIVGSGQWDTKREIKHTSKDLRDYTGIIGAHSAYSTGEGTVKDYADKARAKGYSFIVFTENLDKMNKDKWEQLASDCRRESDGMFLCIPGMEYFDTAGDRYIVFNLKRWPNHEWLTPDEKKVKLNPDFYFGLDWPSIMLVNPSKNPSRPWYCKFYSGMQVIYYPQNQSKPVDDTSEFRQVESNDYNLIPIVGHDIYSPQELDKISGGYVSHALAKDFNSIPYAFKYDGYNNRLAYVSSGPVIKEFAIENGRAALRDEPWGVFINVESDKPITDVTIYDRKSVYCHFHPNTKEFKKVLYGIHSQQRYFTMEVVDSAGRRAISPAVYTSDMKQCTFMCTDLQNTINDAFFVDKGKLTWYQVQGLANIAWDTMKPGLLVPDYELFPPGLDYVIKGFGADMSHKINAADKFEWGIAQRDVVFCSGDVNILDNYYNHTFLPGAILVPTDYADTKVRMIDFTPRPYSDNLMILETETTFKKDCTFGTRSGPELVHVRVEGPEESFGNFTYVAPDGRKVSRARIPKSTAVPRGVIGKGGYVALWPDFYGSVAIYPLMDKQYVINVQGAAIEVGDELPGATLKAGTTVKDAFLLVRGKFGETTDEEFDNIRNVYGLDGSPAYNIELSAGRVISLPLVPRLAAKDYAVSGKISAANLPNDLGIIVEGLNGNWDAGLYNNETKELVTVGIFEGRGYFDADVSRGLSFTAGNLFVADKTDICIRVIPNKDGTFDLSVHNPTAKQMAATIKGNVNIAPLAGKVFKVNLGPGQDTVIKIGDVRLGVL